MGVVSNPDQTLAQYQLLSVQVGQAKTQTDPFAKSTDKTWTSAIDKHPRQGPIQVTTLGLVGDVQANRKFHGGPDKAILAYCNSHYSFWQTELEQRSLAAGAFGENLTIVGAAEPTVCLGDIWQVGTCRLEVSQPRQPCQTLARHLQVKDMVKRVVQTGYSGWYLRVLQEGTLQAQDPILLVARPWPEWTIVRLQQAMLETSDLATAALLVTIPQLAESWREDFQDRLLRQTAPQA